MSVATPEWCGQHFNHLDPALAAELHAALDVLRAEGPVTWSDQWGGFWVVSHYAEVLAVLQDWETFSSAQGVTVPSGPPGPYPALPEMIDPPEHRDYKRIINAFLTPPVVAQWEAATRATVNELIDGFADAGRCEFMGDFATPLPGMSFFQHVIHGPPDELAEVNRLASTASTPITPEAREARGQMLQWISQFVEDRKAGEPVGDVVDALMDAEVDGRVISHEETVGAVQLLLFGGLDTTAGALGMTMVRLCENPEIAKRLQSDPALLPEAAEELLRLDSPFVFIARTATRDVELGGQQIAEGDKVLISFASANRDEAEFACPADFDLGREHNRHLAFGAGPHRCAGSNLARLNIKVAWEELLRRLDGFALDGEVEYHPGFSRTPAAVPLTFTQR